jgi:predicted nucleic acid-binding Zn ribbon protein
LQLFEGDAMAKKKEISKRDQRNLRVQQIVFVGLGILVILSMVIGMFLKG